MTGSVSTFVDIGYGVVTIIALGLVPAAWFFHKKVIRPLRWVLGVAAEDSPTGEEILPVPKQLALLRENQTKVMETLGPNGGSSIIDMVRKTHKLAVSTDNTLKKHLKESAENERDIWKAITTGRDEE